MATHVLKIFNIYIQQVVLVFYPNGDHHA